MKHKIPHTSVQPKPSFGIGNRNQCQISVPYFRDLWTLVDQKNLCTLVDPKTGNFGSTKVRLFFPHFEKASVL